VVLIRFRTSQSVLGVFSISSELHRVPGFVDLQITTKWSQMRDGTRFDRTSSRQAHRRALGKVVSFELKVAGYTISTSANYVLSSMTLLLCD
jgi:hypothetical protein